MKINIISDPKRLFVIWISWVTQHAGLVVSLAAILTVSAAFYAAKNLSINTDTEDMLSSELPFRKNSKALSHAFPQFSDNIVIVVDAPTADQAYDAADVLTNKLKINPGLFGKVFDPVNEPFFRHNGLLYLSSKDLEELVDQLVEAQPFLGRLNASPTVLELFRLAEQILENRKNANDQSLSKLAIKALASITEVIESQLAGNPKPLSWRELISGNQSSPGDRRRIIVIQPTTNFSSLQPASKAIDEIRTITAKLKLKQKFNARVRLTGSLALSQEELQSVVEGLGLAGFLSVSLVIILLYWGLRSITLVISTLITLISGLILTAGFATVSVGTLNLISISFAVLFIGLSVDFGIHYCLRYQEFLKKSGIHTLALVAAAESGGHALALAAIAAAIGFFSFLPTDYLGLAELGLIAGTGILIALVTSFTLLPALIVLLPKMKQTMSENQQTHGLHWGRILGYKKSILTIVAAGIGVSIILIPEVNFDFDPLKLRDPNTESVSTLYDIMSERRSSPYSITILNNSLDEANRLSQKVSSLSTVSATETLSSLVPEDQDEKLELIENLSFILLPSLTTDTLYSKPILSTLQKSFDSLNAKLADFLREPSTGNFTQTFARLNRVMSQFKEETELTQSALDQLEILLLGSLPKRLNELRQALDANKITLSNLPEPLRNRQVSAGGEAKLEVYPERNMQSRKDLKTFVREVQEIAPSATGTPVTIFEAGITVIRAFTQATITTIALITILILYTTRQLREIILILTPLILATLMTATASVIFSIPFNFANMIVLPLLFGLGIAGNIHMVIREREMNLTEEMMISTTPRAVVFSALTTIGSFGSIALSSPPGTSSMGVLLTIAIVSTLTCTLIVLPTMMGFWSYKNTKEIKS